MPDFLYGWMLWMLNWWHVHPVWWWSTFILALAFNIWNASNKARQ